MAITLEVQTITNGVNVTDLTTTINAIKASPAIANFKFRIDNQWQTGAQNQSAVGAFYGAGQEQPRPEPFVLGADEHPILLGKDGAPNPVEYLLHALAACVTTSMVYHAAARGIQIDEIESSLEGDIDLHGFLGLDQTVRQGYQGIRMNFQVKADVPDERLQEIVALGTAHSPVFDTLAHGVPISVRTEGR